MAALAQLLTCLVVGIADGDTLTARCQADGRTETIKVRLAEIDAPESGQAFGKRSKQSLASLCAGKAASIQTNGTDRYGRTIGRVECEGVDANLRQVEAGMAWAYLRHLTDKRITDAERAAKEAKRGLWADAEPVPPWEWRAARRIQPNRD
jgi:endonuclease YncB( thermonuclease family)